ncbi:hypothetical protein Vretifemale_8627 [Volvox reticuliferus]|uniref:thiamine phosphate synthase n=1 Tax=Volvox reticuliferus TaxID=1737510 RepID=A0A8J4CCT6_9CHLO|nr:hypothetical protein Vretifemale_8627 [Volvox reticuliferus]
MTYLPVCNLARILVLSPSLPAFIKLPTPIMALDLSPLCNGSRAFQHYVAQDAYFLKYFARAYGIALSKALALDDDTFNVLGRLLRGVHEELQLHGAYAARWGVRLPHTHTRTHVNADTPQHGVAVAVAAPAAAASGVAVGSSNGGAACGDRDNSSDDRNDGVIFTGPSAATKAYTDFLMEVAEDGGQDGGVAEILAAMLPCSRLYGFLGCALAAAHGAGLGAGETPSHEYWEWVRTYSSSEYLAIPALKEAIFDRLSVHADKARLQSLYRRAMQLEAEFFAAQPFSPPPRRIAALVVDFDETCTQRDTIGGLMRLAEAAAAAGRPTAGDSQWALSTPARLAASYVAQQEQLLREVLPEGKPDAETYDAAGLAAFLERLSDFDEHMNAVVEESGILRGSTEGEVAAAGSAVPLRPHCRETLRAALDRGIPIEVVSVHWSDVYVRAALGEGLMASTRQQGEGEGGARQAAPPAPSTSPAGITLRCNALEIGPDGFSSGTLHKRVQSARDKRRELEALGEERRAARGSAAATAANGALTVYIGDSTSDLGALLAADVGVVVGANRLLRRVAARYGVRLRPLAAAPLAAPTEPPPPDGRGVLYEAAGWEEIRAHLFGVEGPDSHEHEKTSAAAAAAAAAAAVHEPVAVASTATGVERGTSEAREDGVVMAASAAPPSPSSAAACGLPRVLSIAGSDSGGGAGIQADVKTLMARGVFAMTALTALTAQNTHGVSAVHAVPPEFLMQQIDAVLSDLGADAIKTGMLPNAEAVHVVADRIRHYRSGAAAAAPPSSTSPHGFLPLVVDPVLVSTSGHSLAEGGVAAALLRDLLPLATVATPNIPEAEALLACGPITSIGDMRRAARELQVKTRCGAVLIKGGHMKPTGTADDPADVVDILYDGEQLHELRGAWIHTGNTHGTGCTLASAIAAELAKGLPLRAAVSAARSALQTALRASVPLSLGSGVQRPFHHRHMMAATVSEPTGAAVAEGGKRGTLARVDPATLRRQLRLYGVTDPYCNKKCNRTLLEAVTLAVRGGATIIQLREKDIDGGDFVREAAAALQVCHQHGVPLIINDRVDVALAVGADGVHVGQSDLPAGLVRAMIGPARILGVSVKTPQQARDAVAAGADYLGAGAVLPTGTKDTDVIGLEGLAAVCEAAAPLPVVSIGGISAANAADTIRAGCAGIAVVSAIFAAEDVEAAARALLRVVDEALEAENPAQQQT